MELAERLDRFWAALIDRLILVPVGIAAAIVIPGLRHNEVPLMAAIALAAILVLGVVAYQFWLLSTQGQTIGKRAMGLRIVLVKDLSNGGFVTNVLLRAVVPWFCTMVPFLGGVFALADPLFIFSDDRRCIHDRIAGTCVIKAKQEA